MLRRFLGKAAKTASKGGGGKPARRTGRKGKAPKGGGASVAKKATKKL
ncbi:hypothetical protein BH20ACT9_BH20ACT9_00890 [soil metagenome]